MRRAARMRPVIKCCRGRTLKNYSECDFMKFCEFWSSTASKNRGSEAASFRTATGKPGHRRASMVLLAALAQVLSASHASAANLSDAQEEESATSTSRNSDTGPIRLQPAQRNQRNTADNPAQPEQARDTQRTETLRPYLPSEFERYVQRSVGGDIDIRRFGSELMSPTGRNGMSAEASSQIPQDYVISIGDEILVTLWGSVDADLRLSVDRSGRITLPRVGPVMVAGVRYADLAPTIDQRVAQVFRNYKLSASLGRLRSIRVYVTGFTQRPGAYTVSSLATLVNALMQAGGPSAAGSYRNIELRRAGKLVSNFDFYEMLLKGDKSADRALQGEDVIHIGPIGTQVALVGSVNKPAIFEMRANETLDDLLSMAGGFTAVADRSRLTVEHVDARNDTRITELSLPQQSKQQPRSGDLLRAFSAVDATLPQYRQNKRVRIEGEVKQPGEFVLPANSSLADAIRAAGGLTPDAYLFGTEFSRESVRITQQQNYERALRDLETEFTRSATTQRTSTADDAAAQSAKALSSTRLIDRLRAVQPTGRIVLQLNPNSVALPPLTLEDGDRLLIPARPTSIGVFGSVFNGGSYLYTSGGTVTDFLKLAGGPTRGADTDSVFVLRANGSVVSARQKSGGWLTSGSSLSGVPAEPGDTIFVPEELNKTTFLQEAKDWTQILYQFGIGAAALKTIKN